MARDVPVDTFRPIPPAMVSGAARQRQRQRNRANQQPLNGHAMVHGRANALRRGGSYRAPLTVAEQLGMASTLVEQFFLEASAAVCACGHLAPAHRRAGPTAVDGPPRLGCSECDCAGFGAIERTMAQTKQAAVAWAISQDKLALLQASQPKSPEAAKRAGDRADLAGLGSKLSRLMSDQPPAGANIREQPAARPEFQPTSAPASGCESTPAPSGGVR